MNTLAKCIEELKKESPDIRYILGMLETYLELSGTNAVHITNPLMLPTNKLNAPYVPADEEVNDFAKKYEKGSIGDIRT